MINYGILPPFVGHIEFSSFFSERSQAVRNWNISLHGQKFVGLEFLPMVLIFQFLPDVAVLFIIV
ncbi:hypothetical protein EQH94_16020 (plasmid) [Lactiplantibacillus plantarum]|nr:hypothetical protein EQH94_16020 [Lactiplantibacillus plantarum]RWZ68993.1 hypothetical protein EQH87_15545 [Lactiplantibacillus plantarum]